MTPTPNRGTIIALTNHLTGVKDLLDVGCQTVSSTTGCMYIGKKPLIDHTSINISIPEENRKLFTFTTVFAFISHQSKKSRLLYTITNHLSNHVTHGMQKTVVNLKKNEFCGFRLASYVSVFP